MNSGWYFTSEWDLVPVRRGDALGFRAGADYFAELLAPGLSNSTFDARWITLLSWCLKWSHVAWKNAGGKDLSRRDDQRARYAWLRPLELLWVVRALRAGQDTGQLRGSRSIKRWFKANEQSPNFAMSPDQFRRYRQVGTYGAYRVVFRTVSGLTEGGDGWTPSSVAHRLAEIANDGLPHAARLLDEHFEQRIQWGSWSGGNEARYWLERGWPTSRTIIGGLQPTADAATRELLPEKERHLLESVLFSAGSTRRITAEVLAQAKSASSHGDLCDALANSSLLLTTLGPGSLVPLPAFSRFADAAMDAMRALWSEINHDDDQQAPALNRLSNSVELGSRLDKLRKESYTWLNTAARNDFPHQRVITRLAEAMCGAKTPIGQLRVLVRHHHEHGGGRRWFREQSGTLVPLVADTGIAASDYRFRLQSLSRLAAQCGVANMNKALDALAQHGSSDEEGDVL